MSLLNDVPDPVPPREFSGWFAAWRSRPSSALFAIALALAIAALALTRSQMEEGRQFAQPTSTSMGVVRSSSEKSPGRRSSSNELFCWVSYEFTPAGGAAQRNWRFWRPGCGVSEGRPIHTQYVIASPEVNRPAGESTSFSSIFVWFAAGVMLVIGAVVRVSRE